MRVIISTKYKSNQEKIKRALIRQGINYAMETHRIPEVLYIFEAGAVPRFRDNKDINFDIREDEELSFLSP